MIIIIMMASLAVRSTEKILLSLFTVETLLVVFSLFNPVTPQTPESEGKSKPENWLHVCCNNNYGVKSKLTL